MTTDNAAGKAAHTPGPWETDPETEHMSVLGPDGFLTADCAIFGFGEAAEARHEDICRANARLIASAPHMLTAGARLVRAVECLTGIGLEIRKFAGEAAFAELVAALQESRAAISKSLGAA